MDKLPKGWKLYQFDEIANFIDYRGYTPTKIDSGVQLITAKNVRVGFLNIEPREFISEDEYKVRMTRGFPHNGDVLFTTEAPLGYAAILDLNYKVAIGQRLITLHAKNNNYTSKFLLYSLLSTQFQKELFEKATGTTVKGIKSSILKKFQIPLPNIQEQTRIVAKLEALFTRIDKSIILLEENIKHTKGLMASVLEQMFEKLKSESTIYKIKEIAEIKGGKRLPKGESIQDEKTDYPYIRVTDFTNDGTIDVNSVKYMTQSVHEQIKRYIITSKDLYISIAGTIGKTGIIPKELENANLTENAARLVFKSNLKINNRFVYYFTLSDNFKDQVGLATKIVAQPKLALTRLAEVELPIPSIEIQNKEVMVFDELSRKFQEINSEQLSKLAYLKALKSSILDRAFKGEL